MIHPRLNKISVDLTEVKDGSVGRELDMSRVADVQLFMIDVKETIYLDMNDMHLE